MTRGDVVFAVSRALGLDSTPVGSGDTSPDELILMQRWVNQGIRDVLIKTRCYLDEGDMTLTAGVSDYRIDPDILGVDEVFSPGVDGRRQALTSVDNQTLNDRLNTSAGIVGTVPSCYYIHLTLFRVAPLPGDDMTLRWHYVPRPTEILADGSTDGDGADLSNPTWGGIPQEYQDAVELYVLWKGAAYDDRTAGARGRSPGQTYHDDYAARIREINREARNKGERGMHAGRIGYPDYYAIPSRANDCYP